MTVIATAGHVDHGKSTLVEALTGTDPDRWAEEKERGLTIDLGFAQCQLPSGKVVSFVDVPGHIRFLRNMLSGVGSVQGCVFVVSAPEGWKPQSEEHLRILDLLGITHGVVAVTKADLVDEELLELALLDVEEHVEGTFLANAAVVPVSATTGRGIDELQHAIDDIVTAAGPALDRGRLRLWVDRSFSASGAGTVVTGTLVDGSLSVGAEVHISDRRTARVRGLQRHHGAIEMSEPGNRLAVNLTGINHSELQRGDVITSPDQWHWTTTVDAELSVLASLDHPVSRRGAYQAYVGSGEFPVKVRILGTDELAPGATGWARLYFRQALPLLPHDRFILRESGRDQTIGGGHIIDVDPQGPASKAQPTSAVDTIVERRGWIEAKMLALITGVDVAPNVGRWVVAEQALTATKAHVHELVASAGGLGLNIAELDDQQRAVLGLFDDIVVDHDRAKLGEAPDPLADHWFIAVLASEPFAPPPPDGVDRDELRQLVRRGFVIEQDKIYFARSAVDHAALRLATYFDENPSGITVSDARELFGTSRKYVLPLLNWFDNNGMTRRREDLRIAGPRLPDPPLA